MALSGPADPDTTAGAPTASVEEAGEAGEDARTQRRHLAGVWLAAGSAVAAMVFVSWYVVIRNGGQPPGGDMVGHAAAARWLQTLPWWDWRGWSDWFYGGQAMGVNYPPLGHALMRFTHPVHGQMAAVAIGLLLLLPWGALRLARAVGYEPRAQRAAVAAVFVLTAASGGMHWVLSGFHAHYTFFGSWPTMLSIVVGLFATAWAARCRSPLAAGVVVGIATLFNPSVVPGIAVVCAVLLATSGASFRQGIRWAATAAAASVAVSAWWLVPFVAGRERLVRWEVPLQAAWSAGHAWQAAYLALLGVGAALAARRGQPSGRLAAAAGAGLLATVIGDLFGYLRVERWMETPILVAAVAAVGLMAKSREDSGSPRKVRPAWVLLACAFLVVFVVVTLRVEVLPLALWLALPRQRSWAWGGALAWASVLLWVPLWAQIRNPVPPERPSPTTMEAAYRHSAPLDGGLVFTAPVYNAASGRQLACSLGDPWSATVRSDGRVRPLFGLYTETSAASEFAVSWWLLQDVVTATRPNWIASWDASGESEVATPAAAEALGARWYAACDERGEVTITDLPAVMAQGAHLVRYSDEDAWHRAAVEWWLRLASSPAPTATSSTAEIPVLVPSGSSDAYPLARAAAGLKLHVAQDRLVVTASQPGWAWLRVPWDPHWHSTSGTPVHKGGPGHLVVWAERGATELRWSVPGAVDAAAAAATGGASLLAVGMGVVNRRRGWKLDPHRTRPAAAAFGVFADTVDAWTHAIQERLRRLRRSLVRQERRTRPQG